MARQNTPPRHRVRFCLRNRLDSKQGIGVYRAVEPSSTHYGNLMVCGSVWACPVCAAKISERRRGELQQAIDTHGREGGQVLLVTRTFPHSRYDNLPELLKRLAKASHRFKSTRAAVHLREFVGLVGSVRALEVTHGEDHGWHPHVHEVWFVEPGHDLEWLRSELLHQWQRACTCAGLSTPSQAHGVDVQAGDQAAAYAAKFGSEDDSKWTVTHELTKANSKRGREGRSTPFDLLRRVAYHADKRAGDLFREYVEAFHGQRQLYWSKGLKQRFGVGELTDDDIATEVREDAELLGRFGMLDWRLILATETRGLILEKAREGWPAVVAFLSLLKQTNQHTYANLNGGLHGN